MGFLRLVEETTPSTPPASNGEIYITTDNPSRMNFINDAGTNSIIVGQSSIDQGTGRLQNKDLDATNTKIVDGTDTTKKIQFQTSGATTATTLTIAEAQTTSQTLNVPNITASSIVITDTLAQSITGVKTMTNMTTAAGTTSVPSMTFTSGTNMTSPTAGVQEFDGVCFYTTPVASARGVSPSTMFAIVAAGDFSLLTTAGVQSAFAATNDVWSLAASTTYKFEGLYLITHTTTTCTAAMAFALAGGASVTAINYYVTSATLVANTTISTATAATANITWVSQVATTVVTATSTAGWAIRFTGLIQMNAAGTVTPQINWSANTTVPVMKANSFISFTPIGTNTVTIVGNVA